VGSDESGFEVTGLWLGDTVGSDESGFEVTGLRLGEGELGKVTNPASRHVRSTPLTTVK
jgi:hypothetical protein